MDLDASRRADERGDELERVAFLSAALDLAPEPAVVIDRDARLRYANPACEGLFATPPHELLDRPIADFLSAPEADPRSDLDATGECVRRGHFELTRADGELSWVSYAARLLRGERGQALGAVVFLRDETEQRRDDLHRSRRHDELEHALRALAHDLRSPLVSVLGFSRLLRDDFAEGLGERGLHFVERIAEAGRTMESLIRELLDFARIGHAGERCAFVDPREVLHQLRNELKPRLDEHGVELLLPDDAPLVHCDRTRLYQLLSNLIGNAVDHMGPCAAPRVRVVIDAHGDWHRITVRDNGRGIEVEEQERIFDMFHSVPREGGRRGNGLGLAIVKKIAELHGGEVFVESAPGAGAAFHVLLPRHSDG